MKIPQSELRMESRKRDACWDPRKRWQSIQGTLNWAEAQLPVPRNSPQACLAHQRRLLQSR